MSLDLFETERLVLSGWRREQLPDLVRLHGDPLDEWIELFETRRLGKMRVTRKSDGALVGRCGYGIYGPTGEPEIGYSLYPEYWGQGYALEAASGMRDWYFRETDEPHFIGMADVRNAASLKVLERIGMTRTRVEASDEGMLCQFHIMERPR